MGNLLFSPCSGRNVSQLYPNNVEAYLQQLKKFLNSSNNSEIGKFNHAIASISSLVIETFTSINKLVPDETPPNEDVGETLHDIIYNTNSPLKPFSQTMLAKEENTEFEIFKYTDNITYYAGFCVGIKQGENNPRLDDSVMSVKKISASPNGFGLMLVSVGQEYVKMFEGKFKNGDFIEGYIISSDYFYIGEYSESNFNGKGSLYYVDGQTFKGNFLKGKLNGNNCTIFKPKEYFYNGGCVESFLEGEGEIKYLNQRYPCIQYNGTLKQDKPEGTGTMKYRNGMVYVGDWMNGKFHGKGKLTGEDEEYEGEFHNGMKQGHGILSKSSMAQDKLKEIYDGEWKGDEKHGRGTVTFYDGNGKQSVKVGFWKFNKLDKYIE